MPDVVERTVSLDDLLSVSGLAAHDSEVMAPCREVLESGGKRFRPRLLLAAGELGERPDDPALIRAAVAVELCHCASLVHDDVIDDAPMRRSRLTIARELGSDSAALVGGWLFGAAGRLACSCGDTAGRRFARAANSVCDGQMLELSDLFDGRRSRARYYAAIEGKTATLFSLATALGAELAGASDEVVERADRFGTQLGLAYQLLDDILDVAPGSETTGKPPLQDLRHGVYTLPVLYAIERDGEIGEQLGAGLDSGAVAALAESIRATDGPARALEDARAHVAAARDALAGLPGAGALDRLLEQSVGVVVERVQR